MIFAATFTEANQTHCNNPVVPTYSVWAYYAHGRQHRCQKDPVSLPSGRLEKTTRSSPHHVAQHRPTRSETTPPYAPRSSRLAQNRPLWRMTSTYVATKSKSCMPETTTTLRNLTVANLLVWCSTVVTVIFLRLRITVIITQPGITLHLWLQVLQIRQLATNTIIRRSETNAAFLWARKVVFTSFPAENFVSRKSKVVITSGKLGQADSIPSFQVERTWRLRMIWKVKYFNLCI